MGALTPHLRSEDNHDRLPFHPSCPICHETRASGAIASGSVVSVRTQALITAGLLAVSAGAPTVNAIAAEPDQDKEGTAPVTQAAPPGTDPDFDPGGDGTVLPDTAALPTVPAAQPADDNAAVEQTPDTEPIEPVVDEGDGTDAADTDTETPATPAPPTNTATPPQPAAPAPLPTNEPAAAATPVIPEPAPVGVASDPEPAPNSPSEPAPERRSAVRAKRTARAVAPAPVAAPVPATAQVPIQAPAVSVAKVARARPGDRAHTVVAGESLWAIASDLLGGDSSPAQIAREVHHLWQLNDGRIGTGNPDLLPIGTHLVLR